MFVNLDLDVVIAGAGPVGLMLACELQLSGARVLVVEPRVEPDTAVKAEGINAAAAEAFARRGLLPELLAARSQAAEVQRSASVGHFGGIQVPAEPVDEADPALRDRGPTGFRPVQVSQVEVERILGRRARELGVEIRRGVEVCAFDADEAGVCVTLADADGTVVARVPWLVGCDGGRSTVRRLGGFEFVGTDPELIGRQAVATVEGAEALKPGWQHTPTGLYVYGPMPGRVRTIEFDRTPIDRTTPVTAAELEDSLRRVSGVDVRVTDVISAGRLTDNARQATTYRRGRVLLCGDAAHVHAPFSGQGLNLGIGDAVNLGWKLAATVRGWAPADLLDSYTAERHPIGAWVLDWTRAQVAVMRGDAASCALRGVVTDLLGTADGATSYVKQTSGLALRHATGGEGAHPLVGTLAPNVRLDDGRALLVDGSDDGELAGWAEPYADRLAVVRGSAAAGSLLVRPDGVVAWAADGGVDGLAAALTRWLGPVGCWDR